MQFLSTGSNWAAAQMCSGCFEQHVELYLLCVFGLIWKLVSWGCLKTESLGSCDLWVQWRQTALGFRDPLTRMHAYTFFRVTSIFCAGDPPCPCGQSTGTDLSLEKLMGFCGIVSRWLVGALLESGKERKPVFKIKVILATWHRERGIKRKLEIRENKVREETCPGAF